MCFGTYQPNYTITDMKERPDLDKLGDYSGFPFYPVWCIPCEDPTDMFVSSILTTPRYPELFYMFQTDDYIRLDKKWHAYANSIMDITPFIVDESIPDIYCDFIVDKNVFDAAISSAENCILAYPLVLPLFLSGDDHIPITWFLEQTFTGFGMSNMEDARKRMKAMIQKMPDLVYPDDQMQVWSKTDYKSNISIDKLKLLFECTFLPTLYYYVQKDFKTSGLMMDFSLTNPCLDSIFRLYAQSYDLRMADCFDFNEYKRIVSNLQACMPSGEAFLDHFMNCGKPGRNELCPCGSGKKFKKCCGRYM